jgi:hypothetical protein
MSRIAFVDVETVTLDAGPDVMWEIGIITRDDNMPDSEWRFQLRPNMAKANPVSLEIGRFKERYELAGKRAQAIAWSPLNDDAPATMTYGALALTLHTLLDGRSVFGICPSFDTLRIGLFLRKQWGDSPTYRDPFHYQPHDVEDEVAGYLRALYVHAPQSATGPEVFAVPRPTELLAEAVGVVLKPEDKHTALGDARFARDLYDAVTT